MTGDSKRPKKYFGASSYLNDDARPVHLGAGVA